MQSLTSRAGVLGDLMRFLWKRKLWWMIPMIVALLIFGILMALAATGVLSPFMYSLF